MILSPLDLNLLTQYGTVTTTANAFQRGFPAANLTDQEMPKPCIFRGQFNFTQGGAVKIDFTDAGGARVGTLASSAYNSPAEAAIALATAMSGGTAAATISWGHGSTNRYRFTITFASGTPTLDISTGPNAANNALVRHFGFRAADRAASATHIGDFAAIMSPHTLSGSTLKSLPGAMIVYDLASGSRLGKYGFVAGVMASPRAEVTIAFGDSDPPLAATSKQVFYSSGDATEDVLFYDYGASTVTSARYVSLSISDPRREDNSRVGAAYFYHGPGFDTEAVTDGVNFEWGSFKWRQESRAAFTTGDAGHLFAAEVKPDTKFTVSFDANPGLAPSGGVTMEQLRSTLGRNGLCFVALDPTNEPNRLTKLCRLTEPPSIGHSPSQSKLGRYRVTLSFEVVDVR